MNYNFPDNTTIVLETIILDLNGTLSVNGIVPSGVKSRITTLKKMGFSIVLFTGDTLGTADNLCKKLGIEWKKAKTGKDKAGLAKQYNPKTCVAIGNGLIDLELLKTVSYGIVTLQKEGVHTKTLLASDVIVPTINDALDLLINNETFIATNRK